MHTLKRTYIHKKLNIELIVLYNVKYCRINRPTPNLRLNSKFELRSNFKKLRCVLLQMIFFLIRTIKVQANVEIQLTNIDYESGICSDLTIAVMSLTG